MEGFLSKLYCYIYTKLIFMQLFIYLRNNKSAVRRKVGKEESVMPCRVGITTDPKGRRAYWESQVVELKNWRILKSFASKAKAQEYETQYAARYDCQAYPGGPDAPGTWYVYRFDYTRTRG
jgi:hypothetical protein